MADRVSSRWVEVPQGPEVYAAVPQDRTPSGTVVVGMELFGVTPWIERACERLASAGFAALAADFYWRQRRRALLGYDDAGRKEGFALLNSLTADGVVADTQAALDLGTELGAGPRRAFTGFSVGGHLGLLAATRLPFDLVVSCYGGWTLDGGIPLAEPEPPLSPRGAAAIAALGTRVLALVGDRDSLIDADQWHRIGARLRDAGIPHELVAYPGAPHGFLCEDRPAGYDEAAASDAWRRILGALEQD